MTILCAAFDKTHLHLAGDTFLTASPARIPIHLPKWVSYEGWWLGISGDHRIQNSVDERAGEIFIAGEAIVTIKNLRSILNEEGHVFPKDETNKYSVDGEFILAGHGHLFEIGSDFNYFELPVGALAAVGSGLPWAHGGYFAASKLTPCTKTRISLAMQASLRYCISCGGRIWTKSLPLADRGSHEPTSRSRAGDKAHQRAGKSQK